MPEFTIAVTSAEVVADTLVPMLRFRLAIAETDGGHVDAITLQCQIQIEATRRRYAEREQEALLDVFGEPPRWGRTLRTMLWAHASTVVPAFSGATAIDLLVPGSYDLTVAAAKYFYALEDGDAPLCFQFSGTTFYQDGEGKLQISRIPWTTEAQYRMPADLWRRMIAQHHPDSVWLPLRNDVFDRLHRHRMRAGLPTVESVLERLLDPIEQTASG